MVPGHSRLLKFLLPTNKLSMSTQHELIVEYVKSPSTSSIECTVPDQQPLRQPTGDVISSESGGNQSEAASNGTFVPVYNVRVEEAAFTKGDKKLQKVTVTENISDNNHKIVNPMYSEVHSEVINDQQPLRIHKDDGRSDEDLESKKPRSRIPKLRQVGEKFKHHRKEEREKGITSRQPRRSSIPKLKRAKMPTSKDTEINPDAVVENTTNQEHISTLAAADKRESNNLPPEDEFDKMFDEIIQNNEEPVLDTNIIANNFEDAETLEHSFEEIIHDYEENKIKPIDVSDIKRNKPFLKRNSLPDQAFPKKLERRSSLKDIQIDDSRIDAKTERKASKLDEIKKRFNTINIVAQNKSTDTKAESPSNKLDTSKVKNYDIIITDAKETNKEAAVLIKHLKNCSQYEKTIEHPNKLKIESESAKANNKSDKYVEYSKDNRLHNLKSHEIKNTSLTREEQRSTLPSKKESDEELPQNNVIISDLKSDTVTETGNTSFSPDIYITSDSSKEDILDDADKRLHKEVTNTKEAPRSSLEKLNIDEPKELGLNINSTPPNTPQVHENEPYQDSAQLAGEPKILNIDSDDDINKDFASNQVNLYKSRISNESMTSKHRPHRPKLSARDVYNQTDHAKSPSIDFESPNADDFDRAPLFEAYNKKIITEAENKENNSPLQGKVSKIINRIASNEKSTEHYSKSEKALEIPIKKSVSSRIAIFERQVSNPSEIKPKLQQQNPKPKIIEEVLKAQPPRHSIIESERNTLIQSNEINDQKCLDNDVNIVICENKAQVVEVQAVTVSNIRDVLFIERNCVNEQKNTVNENTKEVPSIEKSDSERIQDKEEREAMVKRIQERINTAKSVNEERSLRKRKSVVELDLGDKVKGKVHTMIVRMNSVEKLELEKKNNINIRERPRKKSVSDKIALFEKMLSSAEMTAKASNNGYDVATVAKTPITTIRNTTPKNYQNIFSSVGTDHAVCTDETSPSTATVNEDAISKPPESQMTTAFRNEENVIESIEITNTAPTVTKTDNSETTETTPDPEKVEYYNRRIEELQGAAKKYGRVNMTQLKLRNGQEMPVLVLGTALLDQTLLPHVIGAAIDLGYRAIDTAYIYGNERAIGQAIQAKINDGTVKREDLFIIGKLWSTFHRKDLVEKACTASLKELGLEYFDMYLVHNPMSFKENSGALPMIANVLQYSQEADYLDAWYGMEELVRKGYVRSIGVSNFNSKQIDVVVNKGRIKPAVNMVECHPYLSQQRLDQWCADRNVTLLCYGALGSKGTPAKYKTNQDSVIDDALVRTMAAGLNVSPAQLLIRYQIENGRGVVTKCTSAAHLWDNLQALNFRLGSIEVDALNALNRGKRTYSFMGMGDTHRNYPFKIPF